MNGQKKRDHLAAAVEEYRTRRAASSGRVDTERSAGRSPAASAPEPIAIIGVAGRFPKCRSVGEFWRALDEDRALIEEIPQSRFDWREIYSETFQAERSVTKWGGFIPNLDEFDPEFFGVLADEARLMDPQQRLLTMAVYHALEDAGYAPRELAGSRTGVFVGVERNEYALRMMLAGVDTGSGLTQSDSMLANRISYVFDLDGPSEIVNTMCSSGAVAVHRAVAALRSGDIDYAVVGAANVILSPDVFVKLSAMGQMSPVPTVKSFGAAARGYLRAEGVCSVLLKPLSRAIADGDPIYATILHTAVNYNGRQGTSIAAASVSRHSALIQKCYREAGISVERVSYIEAQGMGNPVSDIAEWNAFNHALEALGAQQGRRPSTGQCHVSTLKPMAGHMHAASSLASLLKVVRSLETGTIYPILDFSEPNSSLDLADRPCALAIERQPWPAREELRLAGIHSHGAGGNNAHLLIQEYRHPGRPAPKPRREVLPVSGRSPALLREQLASLIAEVERHPEWPLASIAHTLQVGRDALADRVAFVAEGREAWLGQARAFLDGRAADGVFPGATASSATPANTASVPVDAEGVLARDWARGVAVEWPRRTGTQRLHLPGLQLKAAPYWFEDVERRSSLAGVSAVRALPAAPRQPDALPPVIERPGSSAMTAVVQQVLEEMLRDRSGDFDLDTPFERLGFDSLMVLTLCKRVGAVMGASIDPAVLFELRTPRAVAERLTRAGGGGSATRAVRQTTTAMRRPAMTEREPIAIIGLSGSYPQARTVHELWRNLVASKDCTSAAPPGRSGVRSGDWAGWLDGVHEFDPLFFHLSPAEARFMHPKERLFMQCAWHAIEDAGYTPRSLEREVVGVFVGVSKAGLDDYKDSYFSLANRVSYRMNFSGPSMPVDTACSASLSAVHEACLHLQTGECTVALVGGVNAYTHPSTFEEFARLGIMSQDGKTRAFGARGSGFVPGEGVGCVLLKPLRYAVEAGDHIYGVILGTAVNHGGRVNGYTVPSPLAHRSLIRLAMQRAGVSARDIGYVEAHGTGTPLGDPVEVRGLTEAFREDTDERGFCALGSIKTNIGHLEAAAGIAGLTKLLLQLEHRKIVPTLHSEERNPHIDFDRTPFTLPHAVVDWPVRESDGRAVPRVGAVSSFGAGGSNAHVIVQEYVEPPSAAALAPEGRAASSSLFVLSARSEAALRRYVEQMAEYLDSSDVDLSDLTFTLQVGRESMEWRLACVADNRETLLQALRSYLASGRGPGLLLGRATSARTRFTAFREDPDAGELLRTWLQKGKLDYIAALWVGGEEFDWEALHARQRRRRVSLPGYPFELEPITPADTVQPVTTAPAQTSSLVKTSRTVLLAPRWRELPAGPLEQAGREEETVVLLLGDALPRPRSAHRRIDLPAGEIGVRYAGAVRGLFREIKSFLASKPRAPRRLQVVVPCGGDAAWLSGVGGLARTARWENDKCRAQLIEVDPGVSAAELDELLAREARSALVDRVRYTNGTRHVLDWEEHRPAGNAALPLRDGGVYLISGGAGGLGMIFAREILERARDAAVVLVGRSALDDRRRASIEALNGPGRRISYHQVDVTNEGAVARAIAAIRAELGALHGVLHCAGLIRDAHILRKEEAELEEVLSPKVAGTVHLDRATADFNLDFFVMFSSAAGAFGHAGQADYAAACAFQDAYAEQREGLRRAGRRSGRTLSIDWGLWEHGGMTISREYQELLRASSGMVAIPTHVGVASLAQCLASDFDQLAVLEVDPTLWKAPQAVAQQAPRGSPRPAQTGARPSSVLSVVTEIAAEQLGVRAADLDVDVTYEECGIDRVALHVILARLSERWALQLDAATFAEATTLRTLSEQIAAGYEPELRQRGLLPAAPAHSASQPAMHSPQQLLTLRERLIEHVKRCTAVVLQLSPERLQMETPFEHYGIDSLKTLQITAELEKALGPLSKTLFFENQTLKELIDHLLDTRGAAIEAWAALGGAGARVGPTAAAMPPETPQVESSPNQVRLGHAQPASITSLTVKSERVTPSATKPEPMAPVATSLEPMTAVAFPPERMTPVAGGPEPKTRVVLKPDTGPLDIAVIGVAGRFPQANNLDELWRVLREGRDCITQVPSSRWEHSRYFDPDKDKPGKTYAQWGGFLDSVDRFDAAFFNISPREAMTMEPQERLFLEVAHEAIESAGYSRQALAKQSVLDGYEGAVGVFAGVTYEEYQLYGAEMTAQGRPMVLSMSPASIANRVSYFCNFHGPSMSVDTMCASSLTTIHLACQSLRNGECRVALAGGVNVSIHPAKFLMLGYGRFASTRGRCQTFGAGADGFVPSEGVGVVVLKPLERALADGDRIYGVIKGSAINHGGKTNGYSVPNPKAQTAVVSRALRQSGIAARDISYLEAHGTGTFLGDPIEIAALNRAFGAYTDERHFCAIGSIKSNIGHCESAAGIAGFTKVLLQMKHETLVPSLHVDELNPNLELSNSPFTVQRKLAPWPRPVGESGKPRPRAAGVSSFGAGGSNAHVIIEEWVAPPAVSAIRAPLLIVLSAKNPDRLREYARRLLMFLRDDASADTALADLAYTLQVGREAMPERLAMNVRDRIDLEVRLQAFVAAPDAGSVLRGRASGEATAEREADVAARTREWCRAGAYDALLQHWVNGGEVDWQVLYGEGARPTRTALPTYPYDSRRYWLPEPVSDAPRPPVVDAPTVHAQETSAAAEDAEAEAITAKVTLLPLSSIGALNAPVLEAAPPRIELKALTRSEAPSAAPRTESSVDAGIVDWLRSSLAQTLFMSVEDVTPNREFLDMGLDSIIGVEWIRAVNQRFGTNFAASVVYEHRTLASFAAMLGGVLSGSASRPSAKPPSPEPRQATSLDDVLTRVQAGTLELEALTRSEAPPAAPRTESSVDAGIVDWLRSSLAQTLFMSVEDVTPNREFLDMGLDSIIGVEWIRAVNQRFGTNFAASVVYEHRTLASFAAMLGGVLSGSASRPSAKPPSPEPRQATSLDDVLMRVQAGTIDVAVAERLLNELS